VETIEGYNPIGDPDALCPFGGGHTWSFHRLFYGPASGKWHQDLICDKCGLISRGWSDTKVEY